MDKSDPTADQKFEFKLLINGLEKGLTSEYLYRLAFIYDHKKHFEKQNDIDGLALFQDLMNTEELSCNDGTSIANLIEALKSIGCTDSVQVLKDYSFKWRLELNSLAERKLSPVPETLTQAEPSVRQQQQTTESQARVDQMVTGQMDSAKMSVTGKNGKLDLGAPDENQLGHGEDNGTEDPEGPCDEQDIHFMNIAKEEATKSPDGKVQVGAAITDRERQKVCGQGHNRMPVGCENLPWDDDKENLLDSKYPYVFHGVKAALKDAWDKKEDLKGAILYTTLFPANSDAQWIVECGIKEVVYIDNRYKGKNFTKASRTILEEKKVNIRRMCPV